jgi:hypothetical protein
VENVLQYFVSSNVYIDHAARHVLIDSQTANKKKHILAPFLDLRQCGVFLCFLFVCNVQLTFGLGHHIMGGSTVHTNRQNVRITLLDGLFLLVHVSSRLQRILFAVLAPPRRR